MEFEIKHIIYVTQRITINDSFGECMSKDDLEDHVQTCASCELGVLELLRDGKQVVIDKNVSVKRVK